MTFRAFVIAIAFSALARLQFQLHDRTWAITDIAVVWAVIFCVELLVLDRRWSR